jgi:hypothetical protein
MASMEIKGFSIPKAGYSESENEDAFSIAGKGQNRQVFLASFPISVAIADGATEASYSRTWARMLTEAFASGGLKIGRGKSADRRLDNLRLNWYNDVSGKASTWYAKEKLLSGSSAAFLGLTIKCDKEQQNKGYYYAYAIGDCCLLHVRNDRCITSLPIVNSEMFGITPALLTTSVLNRAKEKENLFIDRRTWRLLDTLYMATDALAYWFIKELESENTPWIAFDEACCKTDEDFRLKVSSLREANDIRNDDVTLVRISII